MNIFILHRNPVIAARMQCDKHVVKMSLESAQMLSDVAGGPYKPANPHHPCTLWAGRCRANFDWLQRHGIALCEEYTRRYHRRHACQAVIEQIKVPLLGRCRRTAFVLCMPDDCKIGDPVESYRNYYFTKAGFAKWNRGRPPPDWWTAQMG